MGLPRWDYLKIDREVRRRARERKMFFHYRVGVRRYIPVALRPWVVAPGQRAYLRRSCLALQRSALRIAGAWFERKDLQALLPLTDGELRWFRDAYRGAFRRPETLFTRIDVAVNLAHADWRRRARFLEVNLCGIGAAYYSWSAGQIAREVFSPLLGFPVRTEDDLLEMIMGRCRAHGGKIGRPRPSVALLETKRVELGPFEFQTMAPLLRERGYDVVVADPAELTVHRGEIHYDGRKVDLLYRDPTLADLVEMEEEGDDLRAVKLALRRNQVVSSLAGEFDHKGVLELFSSPRWERAFGRHAHAPWTRVLRAERVEGRDLPEVARRRKDELVIKPNRDYGGRGIAIGERTGAAAWDRLIDDGVRHPARYVVQERIPFNVERHPVIVDGRVREEDRFIVTGVHATPEGCALLARMSPDPVVNITRGGAIVGVLVRGN